MTTVNRILAVVTIVVAAIVAVPSTALAVDSNMPSVTSGVVDQPPPEPPLPTPPVDPPHVPVSYTVSAYVDKEIDALPSGEITAREVRRVEDLTFIANKLKLTTDEIKYSNIDKDVTQLKEGDILTVPPVHGVVYKVQDGDTLGWIATSFSVDLPTLEAYDNITDPNHISHDNIFVIPGAKLPPVPRPQVQSYTANAPITPSYTSGIAPVRVAVGGPNHFSYGYCTFWVASKRSVPWFGDAWAWWNNARAAGFPEGSVPRVGAILVERSGPLGHVAYVESVSAGSFTISEENWKAWNVVDYRTLANNDSSIVGFIY